MATQDSTLTAARLREVLSYDPDTGVFHRLLARPCNSDLIGRPAGGKKKSGYAWISIDGKQYQAHRLAWLHYYGEWPKGCLDHINRIKHDNRIANLRIASPRLQSENRKASGVSFRARSGKYHARICVDRQQISIGFFDSWEDARAAYLRAKSVHHPRVAAEP